MTAELVKQKANEQEHEAAKAPQYRIRVAPSTVAYVENHKLVVEFAIPGAPTETIDVKMLEDSVYLTAPAREIEYAAALALGWPVKPGKAEATYEHGLLRIDVPLKRSNGGRGESRHQIRRRTNGHRLYEGQDAKAIRRWRGEWLFASVSGS
jgi:HSP20 family molecular chaperone IbpA